MVNNILFSSNFKSVIFSVLYNTFISHATPHLGGIEASVKIFSLHEYFKTFKAVPFNLYSHYDFSRVNVL